jgi:hypothetical protein
VAAIAVVGQYAFLGDGAGLSVLDVSDPASSQLVAAVAVPGGLQALAASGTRACGGSGLVNLVTFDIAQPDQPQEHARYAPARRPAGVAVGDTFAYVTVEDPEIGLAVVASDGSGPPWHAGFLDLDAHPRQDVMAIRVGALGGTAYLMYNNALLAVDCADPGAPRIARLLAVPDATSMDVRGHHIFVAGDGLRVIDVSRPEDPRQVGYDFRAGRGLAVAADGDRVYVAQRTVGPGRPVSLWVYDVSNPAAPSRIGTLDDIGATVALAATAGRVYQVDPEFGVRAYEARDADRIRLIDGHRTAGRPSGAALEGQRLFVSVQAYIDEGDGRSVGSDGVVVLDLDRPFKSASVQLIETGEPVRGIAARAGRLYVTTAGKGLLVHDAAPATGSVTPTDGFAATSHGARRTVSPASRSR